MTENADNEQEIPGETESRRPAMRFSGSGGLSVAVWKHKQEEGPDRYSVKLNRSYKKGDGQYEDTDYLGAEHLLRAQQLLGQADQWIEQDKGRGQSVAIQVGR